MSDHCCQHDHSHEPAEPRGNGIEHPNVLDALARDPQTGEVVLVMFEPREWTHGEPQLMQLQDKLNAYLSFALDGEMAEQLPQLAGVPVRIHLACAQPPPPPVVELLTKVREQISFQGIGLEVGGLNPAPEGGGCGTGCGCH